jgi:hypothetical protein
MQIEADTAPADAVGLEDVVDAVVLAVDPMEALLDPTATAMAVEVVTKSISSVLISSPLVVSFEIIVMNLCLGYFSLFAAGLHSTSHSSYKHCTGTIVSMRIKR